MGNDETNIQHIVICEDNTAVANLLTEYVKEFIDHYQLDGCQVHTFCSAKELLSFSLAADIAILDIELGSAEDGLDCGETLRKRNPSVMLIMVTGYLKYLDDAMRKQVYRYLSKPIDKNRFLLALQEAAAAYSIHVKKLHFSTADGGAMLRTDEILAVEVEKHTVTLHLLTGALIVRNTFEECRKMVEDCGFFQSHRSFLVNLKYVLRYTHEAIILSSEPEDGFHARTICVPLAYRSKYHAFRNALLNYQELIR